MSFQFIKFSWSQLWVKKSSALKDDQSGVIASQQCWLASWDWNTDRTSPSRVSVSWKIQQRTLNYLWEFIDLNTTGKALSPLFNFYKTTSRLESELAHCLAIFAIKDNWLLVCSNSHGAVLCQNCKNSRRSEWTFCPILVDIRMTHGFWCNGTFIDQFILIFKSDHDLSFSTSKKTLSQRTLKANCISEQTEAIGEMEKQNQNYMIFSSSFTAWRTPLFVYLLLFKQISLVQKGLNTGLYFK